MTELPDEIHEQISGLCARGDDLADAGRLGEALAAYQEAWELLPEPRSEWSAALWILAAIGDAHFFAGDFAAGKDVLMAAMIRCDGATGNPFLRLRLGQCLFELGDLHEASNWMAMAYLSEGKELFSDDDPKYLAFIKSQLDPPPGGWPEGW
jgi:tetratricopeptide (TPR) repeat protein